MRKIFFYITSAILAILTISLLFFDVQLHIVGSIIFYVIYYFISVFVIIDVLRAEKGKIAGVILLILVFILNLFSTSFFMFIPLLLMAILAVIRSGTPLFVRITSMVGIALLICSFDVISILVSGITTTEEDRITNGNISIVTVLVDTGLLGSGYIYKADYSVINGFLSVQRKVHSSDEQQKVKWAGEHFCIIGDEIFKV